MQKKEGHVARTKRR